MDRLRYISVHNYEYILGSQCTSYLQQQELVWTCVDWGADRKDAVLHKILIVLQDLTSFKLYHQRP